MKVMGLGTGLVVVMFAAIWLTLTVGQREPGPADW